MHALIVGARQVGKSTLIRHVLDVLERPVFGYETKKEDHLANEELGSPVYIYPAGLPHVQDDEHLIGYCKDKHPLIYKAAFDRFAPQLSSPPENAVILLDEIGFMESASDAFCNAIMDLLDGDIPVIAAVKHNDTPFLSAVRRHPGCRCFTITPENRNELTDEVTAFMQEQVLQHNRRNNA